MNKVKIDLENCYGIRKLSAEFDFSEKNLFVVYAPNGSMKTSLARTFQDLSKDQISEDRIFKKRITKRSIRDESDSEISKGQVFVIEPYNETYKSSKISTLLVNKTLKAEYDKIYSSIDDKKESLINELKNFSGIKNNIEETLAEDISHDKKEFFQSLMRVQEEVQNSRGAEWGEISYQKIFSEKIIAFLESPGIKKKLSEYMKVYDQLISDSTFFKKGIFNHNNAADIAKNLKDNGFFEAEHSVYINAGTGGKKEIKTEAELREVIQQEKNSILENAVLAKSFEEIDGKLIRNKDLKNFREYLEKNQLILPELENLLGFRRKLWIAYLIKGGDAYNELMGAFTEGKGKIEKIVNRARKEATKWAGVIEKFNERFSVPFIVTMENQEDVILKSEAPSIKFKFKDTDNNAIEVGESDLWRVLSNGERRALYILNIIFEVDARKESKQETLYVVDDIADSFDYKNKYAIVEYLSDISKVDYFYQIILTHNFDFFRTVSSRLVVPRKNKFHTSLTESSVRFVEEKYQNNPFTTWKNNFHNDEMLIASIPFVRNLSDYCGFPDHSKKLTSLLHIKADTNSLTVGDLEETIKKVLLDKSGLSLQEPARTVKELIYELASKIFSEREDVIELEKKIVLSIAIRLKMEQFLIKKINDDDFVNKINKYQTIRLICKFKEEFPQDKVWIKLSERVNLMTPENIHINSFMYEPILDMANHHLKQLYKEVSALPLT